MDIDFKTLLDKWSLPVMMLDRSLCYVYANQTYVEATHKPWAELEGRNIFDCFPADPEGREIVEPILMRTLGGETTRLDALPYLIAHADGELHTHYWRLVQEPVRGTDGTVLYLVQKPEDITAEVEMRRQRDIVIDELNHRVKNLFSVIQAAAVISGTSALSVTQFAEDFGKRLRSMDRTYSRLSDNNWAGLGLRQIFEEELASFRQIKVRNFAIEGPDILLCIRSAKHMAMLIHELVTNATKYGCFSVPHGRLAIGWQFEDDRLKLTWSETGLMGIVPPEREGFGMKLFNFLENIKFSRNFRPEGLLLEMDMPGNFVSGHFEILP